MYPSQGQADPFGYQGQQGYYPEQNFQQHPQQPPYHQQGYPPPQQQQQQQQRGGYPGQGPKPGHGGRSRAADAKRSQAQGKPRGQPQKQQRPPPQQSQPMKQQQPRPRRQISEVSEISLFTKYCLFFANFFFWLAGCACIVAGVWALLDRGSLATLEAFTSLSPIADPVLWVLGIGTIIFALATFGCIGALRENIILLKLYSIMLGFIILLEIGVGVTLILYRAEIEEEFVQALSDHAIANYRRNEDFQDVIDAFQTGLQCCGVKNYDDWDKNEYFNCTEKMVGNNRNLEACGVPFSCCIKDPTSDVINTQCGYDVRSVTYPGQLSDEIYTIGCAMAFTSWITSNLIAIGIVAGVIVLVQVLGFCFAMSLVSDIKRQKAQWQH